MAFQAATQQKKKKSTMATESDKEATKALEEENSMITPQTAWKLKKKKSAPTYTDDALKKALYAIKSGMPVSTASKLHNIPRTTLLYRKRGTLPPVIKNRGSERILREKYERHLVQWTFYMSQSRFPVSRVRLLDSVQLLLNQIKKTTMFKDNRPGRHWYDAFSARHKELIERISQNVRNSRVSVTEEKLRAWFNEVRKYLESKSLLDIDSSRVFNCDESAFFLSPKGSAISVKKDDKTYYNFVNNDEKECLATFICVNAGGKIAPPMIIFSYKRMPRHIAANMSKNWAIGNSDNGWMTGATFYDYIANIFYPWLVKNDIVFPVVLFLDGQASYFTMTLSDFCREKGIELVTLYPNATHILQPLDVAFFHPLKIAWARVVHQWRIKNNGERIKRKNFAQLLQKAFETLDVETILKSGFEKTGLHPFSLDRIDYDTYFQKSVDSKPIPQSTSSDRIKNLNRLTLIEKEVLKIFNDVEEDVEWSNETANKSPFYFWRNIKSMIDNSKVNDGIFEGSFADETRVVHENVDHVLRQNILC